ncbi:MAG: hypothetical protein JKY34_13380 [Kordiimonadaceae bacterium]|nr:hypothetical protein [Kordiimonadaceae bacterium]
MPREKPKVADRDLHTFTQGHMKQCWLEIKKCRKEECALLRDRKYRLAGFKIRDAVEALYHVVLLAFKGYSYPERDIAFLREKAEEIAPDLKEVWCNSQFSLTNEFSILRHARVGTFKSSEYLISAQQVDILNKCLKSLKEKAQVLCAEVKFK